MEGKLVKLGLSEGYRLDDLNGNYIASTLNGKNKLSLKNCEAIENGYDLDELAVLSTKEETTIVGNQKMAQGFIKGFQKALEILGDKKFSEEDMKNAIYIAWDEDNLASTDIIQSLQQTEWDVEIEMEQVYDGLDEMAQKQYRRQSKLDADGCLILKRK